MVNKERIELWAKALESGEYRQGSQSLLDGNKYCCLGVACDLAMKNGVELNVMVSYTGRVFFDGSPSYLPTAVQNWFGDIDADPVLFNLFEEYPEAKYDTNYPLITCSIANDSTDPRVHKDFPQIAKLLRKKFIETEE